MYCSCPLLLVIFKIGCMLWLHCNHTGWEFITGSWVNNGYFKIQLTKANTLHQLPRPRYLHWQVHTVRNNICSTQRTLKRAVSDKHSMPQHQSHGLTSLWCLCCSRAKSAMQGERGGGEGVKDEFIWQSVRLLINRNASDVILTWLSGSPFEIWFAFRIGCAVRVKKDIYKGHATGLFPVIGLVLTVHKVLSTTSECRVYLLLRFT